MEKSPTPTNEKLNSTEKIPEKELKQLGNKLNALMEDVDGTLAIPGSLMIGKNGLNQIVVTLINGDERHTYRFDIKTGSYKDSFGSKSYGPTPNSKGPTNYLSERKEIKPLPVTRLFNIFKDPRVTAELIKQRKEALKPKPKNIEK